MGPIVAVRKWLKPEPKEEPLCPPPVGGEAMEFDEDEQKAVDAALELFAGQRKGDVIDMSAFKDVDDRLWEWLNDLDFTDHRINHIRVALKQVAYERYCDGQLSLAALSCLKALLLTDNAEKPQRHRYGTAELWLLLAHMHASAGRFSIAQELLKSAKKAAKNDNGVCVREGLEPCPCV